MNYEFDDIDYEDMDDLALPDHIEYEQHQEFFSDSVGAAYAF